MEDTGEERLSDKRPRVALESTSTKIKEETPPDSKPTAKKKRRSPAVPWKKPKDMPKRPLSAYNLFFKEERERLLSAGPESTSEEEDAGAKDGETGETNSGNPSWKGGRRHKKTSGIGFANLTKQIAIRWKSLDPKERAPYDGRAAKDKQRYDEQVGVWRAKRKEAAAAEKKKVADAERAATEDIEPVPLAGLFDLSYPAGWFESQEEISHVDSFSSTPSHVNVPKDETHAYERQTEYLSASMPRLSDALSPPQRIHMFHNTPIGQLRSRSATSQQEDPSNSWNPNLRPITTAVKGSILAAPSSHLSGNTYLDSGPLLDQSNAANTPVESLTHPFVHEQIREIRPTEEVVYQPPSLQEGASTESLEILRDSLDDDSINFITSLRFP